MPIKTLQRVIQRHSLFLPGETVVVAVSGGPDSLALLHMLNRMRERLKIELQAATFDHHLRRESAGEVQFVAQTANAWDIPVIVGEADVAALAREESIGIELAARRARYAFLSNVARNVGAKRIATAHHADDQVETVLMHILRGVGTRGLRGMSFQSSVPGAPDLTIVRPLLTIRRSELEAYCRQHQLTPRYDESNLDTSILRNRVRLEVLPYLKTINPQVEQALTQLAEIAATDEDFVASQYEHIVASHIHYEDERVYIARDAFVSFHPALQRRCIYRAAQFFLTEETAGYKHILHGVDVGLHGEVGAVAEFPGGVRLRVDYTTLVVEWAGEPLPVSEGVLLLPPEYESPVAVPGITAISGARWTLRAEMETTGEESCACLSFPPGSEVLLRTRRPGDRIKPLGMGGRTRKIKDWMIDRKIARHYRDRIPLLVVNGEIAAILYGNRWQIAQSFAVNGESGPVVRFFVDNS